MNDGHLRAIGLALTALLLAACASGEEGGPADVGADVSDDEGGGGLCQAPRMVCGDVCVDPDTSTDHCGTCFNPCLNGERCVEGLCTSDCLGGETLCSGSCVFLETDPFHCGVCDRACTGGQVCQGSNCVCPAETTACGVTCADLDTDKAHCGECNHECKENESCEGGSCVQACTGNAQVCDGVCVDTANNNNFCGDCDTQCTRNQVCTNSECVCADGSANCGGTCFNTQSNVEHCGGCDQPCPVGAVCSGGDCACPPGLTLCDDQCVNTNKNADYCGNCETDCGTGVCVNASCQSDCPEGEVVCDGECVDLDSDPLHCTTCETECRTDQECDAGCQCADGFTECSDRCVDTDVSNQHCGACGAPCPEGRECSGGMCLCPEGRTECGGVCVNTATSGQHCGGCNQPCDPLEVCGGGVCNCVAGLTRCGEDCVNTATNPDHCGGCGMPCDDVEVCQNNDCVANCDEGLIVCSGACVDPDTDRQHCSDCDMACGAIEDCIGGECTCQDDFYEFESPPPDNTIDQAMPLQIGLTYGTPHAEQIRLCDENVDWYVLHMPVAGAGLDAEVIADCAGGTIPRISVWNSTGTSELASAEGDGDVCPILEAEGLPAGTLYLKVESTAGEAAYDLFVWVFDVAEAEPNGDPDNATGPFSSDVLIDGAIGTGGDLDIYQLFVPRASTLILETSDGEASCATDTAMYIEDSVGAFIDQDDNGGPGNCSHLETYLMPGHYYLTVYGQTVAITGAYALDVTYSYWWEEEPNDTAEETTEGPFSASFGSEGVIYPALDRDVYEIELTATASIVAWVTGPVTGIGVSDLDPGCTIDSVLELSSDTQLLGDDDDYDWLTLEETPPEAHNARGGGWCSRIDPVANPEGHSFAADLAPGTYTLTVSAYGNKLGPYNLHVEIIE